MSVIFDSSQHRVRLFVAFGSVYFFWGTTYLAIRFALASITPFLLGSMRFFLAGGIMYAWGRMRGAGRPNLREWRSAAILGTLLFVCGNGALMWAEQYVPSGLAALLLACTPLWMVLLDSMRREGHELTGRIIAGLLSGLLGLIVLIGPGEILGGQNVDIVGAVVLVLGSLAWTFASIHYRSFHLPKSLVLVAGMEMLAAAVVFVILGVIAGEVPALVQHEPSLVSVGAVLYLVTFGSIVGYTAYAWLLAHTSPARVATYAYVNPIIALFVGWLIGGEALTLRTLLAAVMITGAVGMIIMQAPRPRKSAQVVPSAPPE
jgi:drug/metabolite transporter (DMT)-like permease